MEDVIAGLQAHGLYALMQQSQAKSPMVILAHGINADLTEDRSETKPGLFDRLVTNLADHDIGTIRFDFRGHGKSSDVEGYVSISSEVEDLQRVLDHAEQAGHDVRAIVGTSFGACATSVVVAERLPNIPALVLINPVVRPKETFLDPGSAWARQSFTAETIAAARSGEVLMLDGEFPLGKKFVDDVSEVDPSKLLASYGGKLAIVHGTRDTYVPFEYSRQLSDALNSTFLAVTDSEHGFGELRDRYFVAEFVSNYLAWAVR